MHVLGCAMGNGFEHPALALDVRCSDLATYRFEPVAFDLVHAACGGDAPAPGVLSVVLERPSQATRP